MIILKCILVNGFKCSLLGEMDILVFKGLAFSYFDILNFPFWEKKDIWRGEEECSVETGIQSVVLSVQLLEQQDA